MSLVLEPSEILHLGRLAVIQVVFRFLARVSSLDVRLVTGPHLQRDLCVICLDEGFGSTLLLRFNGVTVVEQRGVGHGLESVLCINGVHKNNVDRRVVDPINVEDGGDGARARHVALHVLVGHVVDSSQVDGLFSE